MAEFKKIKDGNGNVYDVKDSTARNSISTHTGNTNNPHSVSKAQVGLGNVSNDLQLKASDKVTTIGNTDDKIPTEKAVKTYVDNKETGLDAKINNKANKDGYYTNLTSGNAEQLVASVYDEDKAPFTYRTSGGNASIGNRVDLEKVVGVSVVWNQLINKDTLPATTTLNGITFTNNGDGSITVNGTATDNAYITVAQNVFTLGHKYLLKGCPSGGSGLSGYTLWSNIDLQYDNGNGVIFENASATSNVMIRVANGTTVSNLKFTPQIHDLTAMFQPTIANYLYGLSNNGGVAWFKSMFPGNYYAYDPGTIKSVDLNSKVVTGVNQWDEEWEVGAWNNTGKTEWANHFRNKNLIKVLPNTTYYAKGDLSDGIVVFDSNENYLRTVYANNSTFSTGDNAMYIGFNGKGTTYNHDICINLSHNGSLNGTYYPYSSQTYSMNVGTLRGLLKLDANNKIYADGDEYYSNGEVKVKRGRAKLKDLDWWYVDTDATPNFRATISGVKPDSTYSQVADLICKNYIAGAWSTIFGSSNNYGYVCIGGTTIGISDSNYTDATLFKNHFGDDDYVEYELATPTITTTAPTYTNPQVVNDWGTELWVQNNNGFIPVGHVSKYLANLRDKVQNQPDNAESNGDYLVRQTGSQQSLVAFTKELPSMTSLDDTKTYALKVVNGVLSWVEEA